MKKLKQEPILQEIQAGYLLGERLLRPSLVGISKKNEENAEKKGKKKPCR
jgi:molecular chaperone GrpE (heat shock protein)